MRIAEQQQPSILVARGQPGDPEVLSTFFSGAEKSQPLPSSGPSNLQGVKPMFLTLFIILLLAWIFGFTLFHVTSFLIHILLIAAVIALILHFVRPRSTVA
jgi:hypothetical protein